jgi:polyhydroxybutyrate depolymerase
MRERPLGGGSGRAAGLAAALLALCLACLGPAPASAGKFGEVLEKLQKKTHALPKAGETVVATHHETLEAGGLQRDYSVFAPPGGDPATRPLVIVLHGTYGTGRKMQRSLGFDPYALRLGFLVAYPDAYRPEGKYFTERWNDGRGVLESSAQGVDDVAFIAAMIDDIAQKYGLDRTRVFVTGASNGGIMAYRLAAELGGRIRAIAPVIGNLAAPLASGFAPPPGLSILSINGDRDPFIPLDGGEVCRGVSKRLCEGGEVLSRAASLDAFRHANQCGEPASTPRAPAQQDGTWVEEIEYPDCRTGAQVRSLVVHGMGHVWPPRIGQVPSSGPATKNLDATRDIVEFFLSLDRKDQ